MKDIKHGLWLVKQRIVLFIKGDIHGSKEAYSLLKLHFDYEFERINK